MMKILMTLAIILGLSACSTHLTDVSVLSNKNINLKTVDIDDAPKVKNVVGRDSKLVLVFIPLGTPQLKEAVNDALRKADGDLIVDASVYRKNWWFIIGQETLEINGTVVKTRSDEK